jgi:hypothetical protein
MSQPLSKIDGDPKLLLKFEKRQASRFIFVHAARNGRNPLFAIAEVSQAGGFAPLVE